MGMICRSSALGDDGGMMHGAKDVLVKAMARGGWLGRDGRWEWGLMQELQASATKASGRDGGSDTGHVRS
jgi:hypothetical protein